MGEFPAYVLLSLRDDHLRMLAVWHAVPVHHETDITSFEGRYHDLFRWAQLADLPISRVKELWPALRDLGCVLPDRTLPAAIRGLLVKRVKDMVEGS